MSLIEAGLLDDVRAALPELKADATAGAGPQGVQDALKEWFPVFPQPERSPAEWALFYRAYAEICGMISRPALRLALKAWAEGGDKQFLPKPGELRALAFGQTTSAGKLYAKAKAAVEAADSESERLRIEADIAARGTTMADQAQAVRHMLAQFQREAAPGRERANALLKHGVRNASAGRAPLRPTGGIPAQGSALSPAMHATLKAQGYATETPRPAAPAPRTDDDLSEML
jgi:hypothetical protein